MKKQLEDLRTDLRIIKGYVQEGDIEAAEQWLKVIDSRLDSLISEARRSER